MNNNDEATNLVYEIRDTEDCTISTRGTYSTSGFFPTDIQTYFDLIYPQTGIYSTSSLIKVDNKFHYPNVYHSTLHDYNKGRTNDNFKRWNGLYVFDLDFKKPYKNNPTFYKGIKSDIKKIGDWCSYMNYTFKYSSSGKGIHILLLFDISNNYEDFETQEIRKVVYDYMNNKFEDLLDVFDLTYRKYWDIDETFVKNTTLGLAFAPSKRYENHLERHISESEVYKIIKTHNLPIKDYATDSNINIQEIEQDVKDLLKNEVLSLPRFNPVWKNDERFPIMNALLHIGCTKSEAVNFMYGKSSKATRSSLNSIYDWAIRGKDNPLNRNSWKFLIKEINRHSSRKIKLNINQKEEIKAESNLKIKKYCDEKKEEIFNFFNSNDKVLFQSPTGSGKSTIIIDYVKEYQLQNQHDVIAIACDTITLAEQISSEYQFPILSSNKENPLHIGYVKSAGIYITTYDSLSKFDRVDCLVIDEAHLLTNGVSYRPSALKNMIMLMGGTKKTICVSATPQYLFPLLKDFNVLSIEADTTIKNKHFTLKSGDMRIKKTNKIISHLKQSELKGKCVIYLNNKEQLKELKDRIDSEFNSKYNTVVYYSGGENVGLDYIQTNKEIPSNIDIICTTSILQNGINIWNDNIDRVYTDEVEKTCLTQFESRFRKGGVDVFLLVEDSTKKESLMLNGYVEWASICNSTNIICSNFNKLSELYKKERSLYKAENVIEYNYDIESDEFKTDEFGCAYTIFNKNKFYYSALPENLGYDLTEVRVIDKSDKATEDKSTEKRVDRKTELREFFFEKSNSELIILNFKNNPELTRKKNPQFSTLFPKVENFYNKNVQIFIDSEKELRKMVNKVVKYITYFNLSYKDATKLFDDEPNVRKIVLGFYFNYFKKASPDKVKWFESSIPTQDFPKYKLFTHISNKFKNTTYSYEEIKYKLQELRNEYNFEKYTKYSFKNDNHINELLSICFDVESEHKMIDGKRERKLKLKKYKFHKLLKKQTNIIENDINGENLAKWLTE